MSSTPAFLERRDAELLFGLVAPIGVDRDRFVARLRDELLAFGYTSEVVKLSKLLKRVEPKEGEWKLVERPEAERLESYMTAGDQFRRGTGRNDALVLMAAGEIGRQRVGTERALRRRATILDSLKHADEVITLRQIYDSGVFLVGLYAPESERLRFLCEVQGLSGIDAERLMKRDEEEPLPHGQQARDVFQLSDVFVRVDREEQLERGLARFLDLVFGSPTTTPTEDEHAMFLAYAVAMRSAALGRQVGAVIVSREGDVLAVGANDVPKFGGGQYWPGPDDQRDHRRGHDSNATQRDEIVNDVATRLLHAGVVSAESEATRRAVESAIRDSRLGDVTEYGREVHAEMEAILSCARSGGSTRDATLYTTTFPCHNCAKHIASAGIVRVVFVEPYPKSKAVELHSDSLTLEESERDRKVFLEPFVGVGPRRYMDVFSLRLGSGSPLDRKRGKVVVPWRREGASPRVQLMPMSYLEKEEAAQRRVDDILVTRDSDSEDKT